MQKVNEFLESRFDYIFAGLIMVLPFSNAIPNIILGVLILIALINVNKSYFKNYFKSPYFILTLLFSYIFCQAIFNQTFIVDIEFYKKYCYLIIVPFLFLKVRNINFLKLVSLIVINFTVIISICKIGKFYYFFKFLPFSDGWSTNAVLVLERPYMGIFCVIGAILSFEQLVLKSKGKYLFILSFLLCVSFIFFISIRISIITILILFFIYGFFYYNVSWKRKFLYGLALFSVFISMFFLNTNISKRFFVDENLAKTVQTFNQMEPRVIIWNCAQEITNQDTFSVLFGTYSYTNIRESLVNCYSRTLVDNSRRNWFVETSYNSHSQFIDFYLIGGLIGLFLFIFFFIRSIYNKRSDFCSIAIIVSFILFLTIENVFHRQFGCLIFTIFTSLFLIKNKSLEKE